MYNGFSAYSSIIKLIIYYNHTMIIASIGATNPKMVPSFADSQQLYITQESRTHNTEHDSCVLILAYYCSCPQSSLTP